MTIGTSYDFPSEVVSEFKAKAENDWSGVFPGPPDLCFNYRKIIEQSGGIAVAEGLAKNHRICIIGAGVTGLTAARELLRCGFTQVTLIEQSDRIGGRHLTKFPVNEFDEAGFSPFEMGAMRMPFFNKKDTDPLTGSSLMAYYAKQFNLNISNFPNPGTQWVTSTGIYLREGSLDGSDLPEMVIWKNPDGNTLPPNEILQEIHKKWRKFADQMTIEVSKKYGSKEWDDMWHAIVKNYHNLSFRELVLKPFQTWNENNPGDFGGLGMSPQESEIFYSIGVGDGSWGAFYDVCCLYPIRTSIFGFGSNLQLVHGRVNSDYEVIKSAMQSNGFVQDSLGVNYKSPRYLGLASLDECLLYESISKDQPSFYDHSMERKTGLFMDSRVKKIEKLSDKSINVEFQWQCSKEGSPIYLNQNFDSVIVTVPSWILGTKIKLEGFSNNQLPFEVIGECSTAHWEASCKIYAPLRKEFLNQNTIPQIMVTDTFIHDVYTYKYSDTYKNDCILLSYTWEDDSLKLSAFSDIDLVDMCVEELDRILEKSTNVKSNISQYVIKEKAMVQRWISDENSLGCSKLYRPGTYFNAMKLLSYNRKYSKESGLLFAGEAYSVDAGWTEPCFRGAVDAVINICANTKAKFNGNFNMDEHYPKYRDS